MTENCNVLVAALPMAQDVNRRHRLGRGGVGRNERGGGRRCATFV